MDTPKNICILNHKPANKHCSNLPICIWGQYMTLSSVVLYKKKLQYAHIHRHADICSKIIEVESMFVLRLLIKSARKWLSRMCMTNTHYLVEQLVKSYISRFFIVQGCLVWWLNTGSQTFASTYIIILIVCHTELGESQIHCWSSFHYILIYLVTTFTSFNCCHQLQYKCGVTSLKGW